MLSVRRIGSASTVEVIYSQIRLEDDHAWWEDNDFKVETE